MSRFHIVTGDGTVLDFIDTDTIQNAVEYASSFAYDVKSGRRIVFVLDSDMQPKRVVVCNDQMYLMWAVQHGAPPFVKDEVFGKPTKLSFDGSFSFAPPPETPLSENKIRQIIDDEIRKALKRAAE